MDRRWMTCAAALCLSLGCDSANGARAFSAAAEEAAPPAAASSVEICPTDVSSVPLADEVRETSGLAIGHRDPSRLWTHNDAGNDAELYAVNRQGQLVQRVRVPGIEAVDWEDIEAAPCDDGSCLYVADIGDNDAEREHITIYRLPEPEAGAAESAAPVPLHARFPEGPRDAESLFALPSGDLYVVTKGRRGPISLYRYPGPQRPGETVTLERVRELFPEPEKEEDRVTAATASPDGRWVAIRSYRRLYLYRAAELVGGAPAEPVVVDLEPLGHAQGESVVIESDGTIWLTSEAEKKDDRPLLARLECALPPG